MSVFKRKDFLLGLSVCLLVCFFFWHMGDIPGGANVFPGMLLIMMGICGAGLLIKDIIAARKEAADSESGKQNMNKQSMKEFVLQVLIPAAILLASTLLLRSLGFYLVSSLAVFAIMLYQNWIDGIKPSAVIMSKHLLFAVCVGVAMYAIFHMLISMPTPRGVFGF